MKVMYQGSSNDSMISAHSSITSLRNFLSANFFTTDSIRSFTYFLTAALIPCLAPCLRTHDTIELPSGSQKCTGFCSTYWYGCSDQGRVRNLGSGPFTGGSGVSQRPVCGDTQRAPWNDQPVAGSVRLSSELASSAAKSTAPITVPAGVSRNESIGAPNGSKRRSS